MSEKIRMSVNQTRAFIRGTEVRFVEYALKPAPSLPYHARLIQPSKGWCGVCALHNDEHLCKSCLIVGTKCRRDDRKDCKDGYWKKVNG